MLYKPQEYDNISLHRMTEDELKGMGPSLRSQETVIRSIVRTFFKDMNKWASDSNLDLYIP